MKKYIYYIILILALLIPATSFAQQDRPANAKQTKTKVSNVPNGKSIKQSKSPVKTKDNNDEYSGVTTNQSTKPHGIPSAKRKVDNDTVDVADDAKRPKSTISEEYLFDENPQDKENEVIDRSNAMKERPGMPEETIDQAEELNYGIITPSGFLSQQDDPGTESEEDILMAIDSSMVHTKKSDIANMAPIELRLTNPEGGQYFVFPTPAYSRPTSHWGPRRRRFHYGLDLAMPTGEPIYAAFDGVVRFSKYNSSYGNLIVIRHDNGLETYYAHLSKRHVTPGTRVRAGEEIGLCGNTGRSRGSHLHFEIRYQGNAINPEKVISCETRTLISQTLTLNKDSFRKAAQRSYSGGNTGRPSNYSSDGKYYKVRSGDTLGRIAQRNGTTVSKLRKLNGLKNDKIRAGQTIRIR